MEQTRHRRGAKSPPPQSPRTKGERRRRAKATSESNKSLQERRRRSTSTPTQPQTSTTPRRASRGPTKVDYVFRWRFTSFTSKGPRHQGAVWRFNIIYKEQGTISIIELLAHKQNLLQSKQVPGPHADAVSLRPAHALLSFIFENPPPSPHDRPWSTRTTDARSASDQSRERSSQAPPRDSR